MSRWAFSECRQLLYKYTLERRACTFTTLQNAIKSNWARSQQSPALINATAALSQSINQSSLLFVTCKVCSCSERRTCLQTSDFIYTLTTWRRLSTVSLFRQQRGCQLWRQCFLWQRVATLANCSQWTRPSAPTPASCSSSSTENTDTAVNHS